MIRAGFAKGSEFTWDYHYGVYWDLTQRLYREELDPSYDGDTQAGTPFCQSGTPDCDADYHYADRPVAHRALAKVALTGDIQPADAHPARHDRRAAADPHRLRRLPADDPAAGPRIAAPLLPGRRAAPTSTG